MEDSQNSIIYVYAGTNENGIVQEELLAKKIENNIYQLISSPGLALNLAKGDIIDISNNSLPAKVLKRGGNFCIQIYADFIDKSVVDKLALDVKEVLSGSLDGVHKGNLSLSVPSKNGIDKINNFFDDFTESNGIQWYYCNIYKNFEDPDDETLLDWWLK